MVRPCISWRTIQRWPKNTMNSASRKTTITIRHSVSSVFYISKRVSLKSLLSSLRSAYSSTPSTCLVLWPWETCFSRLVISKTRSNITNRPSSTVPTRSKLWSEWAMPCTIWVSLRKPCLTTARHLNRIVTSQMFITTWQIRSICFSRLMRLSSTTSVP